MTVAMDTFSAAVKVIFVMGILKQFNIKNYAINHSKTSKEERK